MEFHLFPLMTFLALTLLGTNHATNTISPEAYWNTVLPNSPMPKAIKTRLPSTGNAAGFGRGGGFYFSTRKEDINAPAYYSHAGKSDQIQHYGERRYMYFLEKDLKQGRVLKLDVAKNINGATFIPRDASKSMPFSSEKITDVLNLLRIEPTSKEAEIMKETIRDCEEPALKGEQKYCATSLESMIDYSTSLLGKNVRALSTELSRETGLQEYTFTEIKKLVGRGDGEILVGHMQSYGYAVYYLHSLCPTTVYMISLVGADGTKGKGVAVCHLNTSSWNVNNIVFQMLKVKPGTTLCHILPEDNIIWVPLN